MIGKLRAAMTEFRGSNSLSTRALRSGVWIGAGYAIQRALQFGSNLILTRLLFPEAFGTMALATVFVVGLAMFSDLGIRQAIIRDLRGDDPDFLNTAWTLQIARGFLLFIGGCLIAYPVSRFYEQPILFPLLIALSTTAAISGFQSIRLPAAERDLDFLKVTVVQLAGQAISIVALVSLAYSWRSVWALAAGNIIGSLATVLMGYLLLRGHKHKIQLEPRATRSIIQFGKWIFLSTIVTFIGGEGLRVIQAKLITPAEFGVLAIAYTISAIPVEFALRLTGSIGQPALSEAYRTSMERLTSVLQQFRKRLLGLSFVMIVAVALVSELMIELLYDRRYHDAGEFTVALVLANGARMSADVYFSTLLATGRSRTYFWLMTVTAMTRIAGTILGFHVFGVVGMIAGVGIANMLNVVFMWPISKKLDSTGFIIDGLFLLAIALTAILVMKI